MVKYPSFTIFDGVKSPFHMVVDGKIPQIVLLQAAQPSVPNRSESRETLGTWWFGGDLITALFFQGHHQGKSAETRRKSEKENS